MLSGVPLGEVVTLAVAVLVGGAVTGLLAGLFGIGGGAIAVPVLYEVFGVLGVPEAVRMQLCIGTSLAIIVPTSLRSYLTHRRKGTIPPGILRVWAAPAVAGVVTGSLLAAVAPAWVFKVAFVVVTALIASKLLFGRADWRLSEALPGRGVMSAYGYVIGLYASLVGVGGGSLVALFLTLHGETIHVAVAVSAGLGFIIAGVGTLGYVIAGWPHGGALPPFSVGFVSLVGVVLMAPVSTFTASYGARLAHAMPRRRLEIAFGCFLYLVAFRFLVSLFWA
jgi:uncharacterized membrane protein YfcA